MNIRPFRPSGPAFVAPLLLGLLAPLGPAAAQEGASLAERRLAIQKGTAPGKVLIEAPLAAASAASAPRGSLLSRLPPPSGRPLNAARKLDAPDQGIVINPAAPAASAPR